MKLTNEVKILGGLGIVTLALVIGAAVMFGGSSTPEKATVVSNDTQKSVLVHNDSHQIKGKNAKVTLVEFGDFQCPACGVAYPIVHQLLQEYNGKINFVFRNYPLQMHRNARTAANVAEAAGAQGKFFPMFDVLYQNQNEWGESPNPNPYFVKYAEQLGLNMDKFNEAVKNKTYDKRIEKDIADGNSVSISATPTFFLNGEQIVGGLPYDEFKSKIDAALKAAQ